eukprot:scaffold878_cov271-Pinguiococcus_pyrenoidosus.AAC.72
MSGACAAAGSGAGSGGTLDSLATSAAVSSSKLSDTQKITAAATPMLYSGTRWSTCANHILETACEAAPDSPNLQLSTTHQIIEIQFLRCPEEQDHGRCGRRNHLDLPAILRIRRRAGEALEGRGLGSAGAPSLPQSGGV